MNRRLSEIKKLKENRPRQVLVIWSVRAMGLLMLGSWFVGDFNLVSWFSERRVQNLQRFLGELRPWPVQQGQGSFSSVMNWATELWSTVGAEAFVSTLAISVLAIVLAGLSGAFFSLFSARNLACAEPFLPEGGSSKSWRHRLWNFVVVGTRALMVFIRAVPEYVWAFLFLALFGPNVWPMVLALALHNAGILGKLSAELIENVDDSSSRALRGAGASRFQILWASIVPLSAGRFLLYFFYRWETCVREATVLGMLGMASLGLLIVQSRAANRYDEMFFYILLGALLVLLGDLASAGLRRFVRRA